MGDQGVGVPPTENLALGSSLRLPAHVMLCLNNAYNVINF